MPTNQDEDPAGRMLLRCAQCGWTQTATHADLARYEQDRWPSCCGQAMEYFTRTDRPTEPPQQ